MIANNYYPPMAYFFAHRGVFRRSSPDSGKGVIIVIPVTLDELAEIHSSTLFVPPDIFHQVRIIDKRVAVALNLVDLDGSCFLFLAHRVHPVPLQQQVAKPRSELLPSVIRHGCARFACFYPLQTIPVACSDIEIGAGKVPLVFIRGAEYFLQAVLCAAAGSKRTVPEGSVGGDTRRVVGF